MLIELWERIRGYDKWTATKATIGSSDLIETPVTNRYGAVVDYTYKAGDQITWTDPSGEKHSADFNVDDQSPLYQYVGGESVPIRYNPLDPDRFYYRDLLKSRIHFAFRVVLGVLAFLVILILFGWLHVISHR